MKNMSESMKKMTNCTENNLNDVQEFIRQLQMTQKTPKVGPGGVSGVTADVNIPKLEQLSKVFETVDQERQALENDDYDNKPIEMRQNTFSEMKIAGDRSSASPSPATYTHGSPSKRDDQTADYDGSVNATGRVSQDISNIRD